ncbi:MAG: hypothetical protein KAY32_10175 [Candidatus Eisenbacteria sp.]|nr:hypothetical protein [Candidatus Eisenbacteria bacterium]
MPDDYALVAPQPGDIMITEILQNPDAVHDDLGEWQVAVPLDGARLAGGTHTVPLPRDAGRGIYFLRLETAARENRCEQVIIPR